VCVHCVLDNKDYRLTLRICDIYWFSMATLVTLTLLDVPFIVMRRLTTGMRSEKCVFVLFRRSANFIECTYTNLDSTV